MAAKTYKVGSGQTYSTIADAEAAIGNSPTGVQTIEIYNGTYDEQVTVNVTGTSDGNNVKIVVAAGNSITWNHDGSSGNLHVSSGYTEVDGENIAWTTASGNDRPFYNQGGTHSTFKNITVSDASYTYGIYGTVANLTLLDWNCSGITNTAVYLGGTAADTVIERCLFTEIGGGAAQGSIYTNGDVVIRNCIFDGDNDRAIRGGVYNTDIFNCTFYNIAYAIVAEFSGKVSRIVNNIFHTCGYALYNGTWGGAGSIWDYNYNYNYTSQYLRIGGSTYANLAAFQAGETEGDNDSESDPKLNNPAGDNFDLASTSPCINTANPTYAPADDYHGDTRDANPDIGADEYLVTVSRIPKHGFSNFQIPAII